MNKIKCRFEMKDHIHPMDLYRGAKIIVKKLHTKCCILKNIRSNFYE